MAPSRATAISKAAIFSAVSGAPAARAGVRHLQAAEDGDQRGEAALGGVVLALLGDAAEDGVALPRAEPAVGGDRGQEARLDGVQPLPPRLDGAAGALPLLRPDDRAEQPGDGRQMRRGLRHHGRHGGATGGSHAVRQVGQGRDAGQAAGPCRLRHRGAARLPHRLQAVLGGARERGAGSAGWRLDRLDGRQLRQAMGVVAERGEAQHRHLAGRLRSARGGRGHAWRAALATADGEADRGILAQRHALEAVHPQDERVGAGIGPLQRGAEAERQRRGRILRPSAGTADGQQGQEKDQAATQGHAGGASMGGGK